MIALDPRGRISDRAHLFTRLSSDVSGLEDFSENFSQGIRPVSSEMISLARVRCNTLFPSRHELRASLAGAAATGTINNIQSANQPTCESAYHGHVTMSLNAGIH